MLEVRRCSIRFGGIDAVSRVSLSVKEWEIVGIIGPNGAGKTTTFDIISGFLRPDEGIVLFRGADVTKLPVHSRAALGMGRTFQNVGLLRAATVMENVRTAQHLAARYSLTASLIRVPSVSAMERDLDQRARQILDLVGIRELVDTRVSDLPYGELKRAELAAVLATGPELLLLDEPSSGMSAHEAEIIGELLVRLRSELGLTIAMIEHHVPLVMQVCDYVYCLNFGRVLARGTPEEVRSHPEVVRAYLGEDPDDASSGPDGDGAANR